MAIASSMAHGGDPGVRRYELFTHAGHSLFAPRLKNEGVAFTADGIEWTEGGASRSARFADVAAVRLLAGYGDQRFCKIDFQDGSAVKVMSSTKAGRANPARSTTYSSFVRDLHARLDAGGHRQISFGGGVSVKRYRAQTVGFVLMALLFLGGPLAMFLTGAGGQISWVQLLLPIGFLPFFQQYRRNKPRAYSPDKIPDELLP